MFGLHFLKFEQTGLTAFPAYELLADTQKNKKVW